MAKSGLLTVTRGRRGGRVPVGWFFLPSFLSVGRSVAEHGERAGRLTVSGGRACGGGGRPGQRPGED
ncbi:unnamed protein product [Rangifer tarandus platyrhynchus]|uniref:Uncharacterized protein n=1 Tax=Rangifer tarandus platyrhynchus TaxID=3082113 RepID=A0ABN9A123_RANTA|nr:unnamed protein product [Rangifer tarandus platyrhynchus]